MDGQENGQAFLDKTISTIAVSSPDIFREAILLLESVLMSLLEEGNPIVLKNTKLGFHQSYKRAFTMEEGYPELVLRICNLIRLQVESLVSIIIQNDSNVPLRAFIHHWSQKEPPVTPFIQPSLILD